VEEKDLPQLAREFVEALALYLRQQGREFTAQVVMGPLRRAGRYLLLLTAVATLLTLGMTFTGIGAVMGLAQALGSLAAAFALVGVGLLLAAGVIYWVSVGGKPRKGADQHDQAQP
jgi:hypothetical protein